MPAAVQSTTVDGCLTDPEPGMDSRRATVRNMRSKCRCSCVLQFTFRRAVSCVLHRPPSQVIHCTVLFFSGLSLRDGKRNAKLGTNVHKCLNIPTWGGLKKATRARAEDLRRQSRTQSTWPPPQSEALNMPGTASSVRRRGQTGHPRPGQAGQERNPPGGEPRAKAGQPRTVFRFSESEDSSIVNDPSAGSPTETLLRLLLPLNAQVWKSSRLPRGANLLTTNPNASLKRSIGSSDGRCVQRAGT